MRKMESVDMEISSATEEEEDEDEAELNKLLNSLSGMEKCLIPIDSECDVAVIDCDEEDQTNNNDIVQENRTETLQKTKDDTDAGSVIAVSPISSNASTLSRQSTPERRILHCQKDCDNDAQSPTQVTIAQLLDKDSENDVILDSINEYRRNLESESASDHSDVCFLGIGTEVGGLKTKSKQSSTLPDNSELNSKSNDSVIFDGAVTGGLPKNAVELSVVTPAQTQSEGNEKASSPKDNDSDSDCLIVEHIAASDHRLNGLIDLTRPDHQEDAPLPLENRTEESLLNEISQIRKALMKHSTKKHKKGKKSKRHKSRSSSKRKKKSKNRSKSPSLEKISENEDDFASEPRGITLSESGKLKVNISNDRSKTNSSESDDSSKTTKSKRKQNVDTTKTSESKEKETADSSKTTQSKEKENAVSAKTTKSKEKENVDSSKTTQLKETENADSSKTTESKENENAVNNCSEKSTAKNSKCEENPTKINKSEMQELLKVPDPSDKMDSADSPPLWNSDSENIPEFSENSSITRPEVVENSNVSRPNFDDTSRVTVLTFGIKSKSNSAFDSNPLRRKLSYCANQNDFANKKPPRRKRIFCESGKELQSKFRRQDLSRGNRGAKKNSFPPNKPDGYLYRSDGSDSSPEKSQQSVPSVDKFNRFMSDSDSDKSTNLATTTRSKTVERNYGSSNWRSSVPEFSYRPSLFHRSRSLHKGRPSSPNLYRSLSRSPPCYRSRNPSSYRSPSPSYRSKSRHKSKTPSITRDSYYRTSLSRSRSPDDRLFRSKSRSHRSKSRALRSPSRSRRSRSRTYRSPSVSRRSPSRSRRSKSRTYRSPSRSRRSKSRTYRSPSRSRRSKSRRRRSKSRRNSSRSSSDSRSPSIIRAARACSPLEDIRQQLRKNNESAVLQALGGLEQPTKGGANLKACKPRVIDDVDLTTSPPSPETCRPTEINVLNRNARTVSAVSTQRRNHLAPIRPLTGFGPIRMHHPGYMAMPQFPMMQNPGVMNQMGVLQIGHVFSQALGPPERPLGPRGRPLEPLERPLGPPDGPLGPPDRPLGPPERRLRSPTYIPLHFYLNPPYM